MNNRFWLLWNPKKDVASVFTKEPVYSEDNGWHLEGWLEGEGQGELFEVPKFSQIFPRHQFSPDVPHETQLAFITQRRR